MSKSKPTYEELLVDNKRLQKLVSEKTNIDNSLAAASSNTDEEIALKELKLEADIENMTKAVSITDINERKLHEIEKEKSNKKIEESEKLLRLAQKSGKIGIWSTNLSTRETYLSEEAANFYGLSEGTYLKKDLYSMVPEKDASAMNRSFEEAVKEKIPFDVEHRIINKNTGELTWVHTCGEAISDSEEKTSLVLGTALDITKRKSDKEELLQSEARLKKIIDTSPFPIAVVDADDDVIQYWSQSALKMFGHNPNSAEEWHENAYPDPVYRQKVIERWKPFLKEAKKSTIATNTGEYNITCKDGSVKVCEIYAQFIPGNFIITMHDVTEQIQSEIALIESEQAISLSNSRYKTLFNDSPVPLWEEDFTDLAIYFKKLKKRGHLDLGIYLENNPGELLKCANMVKILDVNQAALNLHKAESRKQGAIT